MAEINTDSIESGANRNDITAPCADKDEDHDSELKASAIWPLIKK